VCDVCGAAPFAQARRGISPLLAKGGVSPGLAKVAMGVEWAVLEGE